MSRQITTQNTNLPQGQKASIRLRSNESNKPRSTAAVFGPVQGTTTGGLSSSQMEQPVLKQVKLKQQSRNINMSISLKQQTYPTQLTKQKSSNRCNVVEVDEDYQQGVKQQRNGGGSQHNYHHHHHRQQRSSDQQPQQAKYNIAEQHSHQQHHPKQSSQSFQQLLPLVELQKMKISKLGQVPVGMQQPTQDHLASSNNNIGSGAAVNHHIGTFQSSSNKRGDPATSSSSNHTSTTTQLYAPSSQAVVLRMLHQQQNNQYQQQQKQMPRETTSKTQNSGNSSSQQKPQGSSKQVQPTQRRTAVLVAEVKPSTRVTSDSAEAQGQGSANSASSGVCIPAFTSEKARQKCEIGQAKYPGNPQKYRKVNIEMDKELIWYRTEIEKRFQQSEMQLYKMKRTSAGQRRRNQDIVGDEDLEAEEYKEQRDQFGEKVLSRYPKQYGGFNASSSDKKQESRVVSRAELDAAFKDNRDLIVSGQRQSSSSRTRSRSKGKPAEKQAKGSDVVRVLNKADFKKAYSGELQTEDDQDENLDARQSMILDEGQPFYKVDSVRSRNGVNREHSSNSGPFTLVSSSANMQHDHVPRDMLHTNENYMSLNQNDLATITQGSNAAGLMLQNSSGSKLSMVSPSQPASTTFMLGGGKDGFPSHHHSKLVSLTAAKTLESPSSNSLIKQKHHPKLSKYAENEFEPQQNLAEGKQNRKLTSSFSKVELKKANAAPPFSFINQSLSSQHIEHLPQNIPKVMPDGGEDSYGHQRNQRSQTHVKTSLFQFPASHTQQSQQHGVKRDNTSTPIKVRNSKYRISMAKKSPNNPLPQSQSFQGGQQNKQQHAKVPHLLKRDDSSDIKIRQVSVQNYAASGGKMTISTKSVKSSRKPTSNGQAGDNIPTGKTTQHQHHKSSVSLKKSITQMKSQRSGSSSHAATSKHSKQYLAGSGKKAGGGGTQIRPNAVKQRQSSTYKVEEPVIVSQSNANNVMVMSAEPNSFYEDEEPAVDSSQILTRSESKNLQSMAILEQSQMKPISASKKTRNQKVRQHQSLYDYVYPSTSLNDQQFVGPANLPLHRQDSQPQKMLSSSFLKDSTPLSNTKQKSKRTDTVPSINQHFIKSIGIGQLQELPVELQPSEYQIAEKSGHHVGLPQIQTDPMAVEVKSPPLLQLNTEGDAHVGKTEKAPGPVGTKSANSQPQNLKLQADHHLEVDQQQIGSTRLQPQFNNKYNPQVRVKQKQTMKKYTRNSQQQIIAKTAQDDYKKQEGSLGRVDLSNDRATDMNSTNASGNQPPIRLKRQEELLLKSFDGNSVVQAYDSSKYEVVDTQKRSGSSDQHKQQQQVYRRHQSSSKRSQQKSMAQARINTSMDETLSQIKTAAKSPTLSITNQSGANNFHQLTNQNDRMAIYSKHPLKSSLSISQSNQNIKSSFNVGEEANIVNEGDSIVDLRFNQSRQPMNISISKIQGATMGSLPNQQPMHQESSNLKESKGSSIPRKQRQHQSFIDLEAIKKSINKKISQVSSNNKAELQQQEKQLMAALKTKSLIKPGSKSSTSIPPPATIAGITSSSQSFSKQQLNAYGQEKHAVVLNRSVIQIPNAQKLQELQKNQQMIKKAKKRNQGLIINNQSFQQQSLSQMMIHTNTSQSINAGAGAQRKQKLNSRNQTFSMSQEGFVLTASRSKNMKQENANNSSSNPKLSSLHDAYQTPGCYQQQQYQQTQKHQHNEQQQLLMQETPHAYTQQKATVSYGALAQKQRTVSATKMKQQHSQTSLTNANKSQASQQKPTHARSSIAALNNYFMNPIDKR